MTDPDWFKGIQLALSPEPGPEDPEFFGEGTPESLSFVFPWMLRPGENASSGMGLLQWFRFIYDGDSDLALEEMGNNLPKSPLWMKHMDEPMIEVLYRDMDDSYANGDDFCRMRWALNHGIAPGQPFLVAFDPPRFVPYSDGECDVELDWEVVLIPKCSERKPLKAWTQALRYIRDTDAYFERRHRHRLAEALRRNRTWRVSCTGQGLNRHSLQLEAELGRKLGGNLVLIERVTHIDYHRAFLLLMDRFREMYPEQDASVLLALYTEPLTALDVLMMG